MVKLDWVLEIQIFDIDYLLLLFLCNLIVIDFLQLQLLVALLLNHGNKLGSLLVPDPSSHHHLEAPAMWLRHPEQPGQVKLLRMLIELLL